MNETGSPTAPEQKRGSERVFLRIPIRVEGKDAAGQPFAESTFTLVINRNGARISLKRPVRAGDELRITNPQTQMSCPFRVVRAAGQSLTEGPEWGVECLEPDLNFWGISFPKAATAPPEEEKVDALLECSACQFRELASLALDQYRSLIAHSFLNRRCPRCQVATEWRFGFVEAEREEAPSAPNVLSTAEPSGMHQRGAKRVTVKLPVRIRVQDGTEEIAKTENLSRTGVCFISRQIMQVGDIVKLTVGYAPGTNETEIAARVMWRRPLEGQSQVLYGVHLEE